MPQAPSIRFRRRNCSGRHFSKRYRLMISVTLVGFKSCFERHRHNSINWTQREVQRTATQTWRTNFKSTTITSTLSRGRNRRKKWIKCSITSLRYKRPKMMLTLNMLKLNLVAFVAIDPSPKSIRKFIQLHPHLKSRKSSLTALAFTTRI